jgi:hypothetical protein
MPEILDAGNRPISYISLQQQENTDSQIIFIRVPCSAGQFLAANDVTEARVLARLAGSSDPFVDLFDNPIDLTPFDGTTTDFDIKVHTGLVTGIIPTAVEVKVTYNP